MQVLVRLAGPVRRQGRLIPSLKSCGVVMGGP